jgi:hypothetical protein
MSEQSMNDRIESMILIAYAAAVNNTRYSIDDKTPDEQAREWLETARWDGTFKSDLK